MDIKEKLLSPNRYSRPKSKLKGVKGIVWHWFASVSSDAENVIKFFDNRKYGKSGFGSAQYIIAKNGKLYRCIPDSEIAYHVGSHIYTKKALQLLSSYPNNCTIGIECAHLDMDGTMSKETYETLIDTTVYLLKKYGLGVEDIWLHQEVVGWKDCHRYYVNNPEAYRNAKEDVAKRLGQDINVVVNPVTEEDLEYVDTLGIGDRSEGVKELQYKLNKAGYDAGNVDGIFGGKTQDAVEALQEKAGIVVDGIFGTNTREALDKALEKKETPKQDVREAVIKDDVWVHSRPDFKQSTQKYVAEKGKEVHVYYSNGDLYNIGNGEYVSKKYIAFESHKSSSYPLPSPYLRKNDRGSKVKMLQNALNAVKFNCGKVDGIFGRGTDDALRRFQSMYANPVDGVYGNKTKEALQDRLKKI